MSLWSILLYKLLFTRVNICLGEQSIPFLNELIDSLPLPLVVNNKLLVAVKAASMHNFISI